mgnify:CR=1 FL=1
MAKQWSTEPELTIDTTKKFLANLDTNHGPITIDLFAGEAPLAVNNFVFLAGEGFYDGVIFHRVIRGFVAQGGDPTGTGTGGPGYRFRDELDGDGSYARGRVAMANSGPNTNGSQFFICLDNVRLPHAYTIFGEVTSGMETADAIAAVPTERGDRPSSDCVIQSVTITTG